MAKQPAETKSKLPQSNIPVISSRPSHSSLPSSLSTPHLGLVPPSRHLAVSGSPAYPSESQNPSSSGSGGLASFRSIRSLLPFGPGKSTAPNGGQNTAPPTRPSFVGLRRSANGERSVSAPQPQAKAQEEAPVLSIDLPHASNEPLINDELQSRLGLQPETPIKTSPRSSPRSTLAPPLHGFDHPVMSPAHPGVSDLSTILESETSNISIHEHDRLSPRVGGKSRVSSRQGSPATLSQSLPQPARSDVPSATRRRGTSNDTSPLDLSVSHVTHEVLEALNGPAGQGWLDGAVIVDSDSRADTRPVPPDGHGDPDVSFNLGALDPDLAALLSPNKMIVSAPDSKAAFLGLTTHVSTIMLVPPSTDTQPNTPSTSPQLYPRELSMKQHTPNASPTLSTRAAAVVQISPLDVRRSSSFSRPSLSHSTLNSGSSVPRLARPSCTRPTEAEKPFASPTSDHTPGSTRVSESSDRPNLLPRKPRSPLLAESPLPRPSSRGSDDNQAPASRLAVPTRRVSPSHLSNRGAASRISNTAPPSPGWDGDMTSSASRPPPGFGSALARRLGQPRPSLDTGPGRPKYYTRDRSASVSEISGRDTFGRSSASRAPTEGMGPRTARAFAAAGLLSSEREPPSHRSGSRFSVNRSERDIRSLYAPSRIGFSETGSVSSWGHGRRSGSISRTGSEVISSSSHTGTGTMSESASPRTTFSASASTVPTSISTSSSVEKHLQVELEILQEKHALETSALLNALADSQRTTRMLRDENIQLRNRLLEVEERLASALDELQRMQSIPPPALPRSTFQRLAASTGSEVALSRRTVPQSRLQTLLHRHPDLVDDEDPIHLPLDEPQAPPQTEPSPQRSPQISPEPLVETEKYLSSQPRRYSSSSSVFRLPPSNMTMLMHEGFGVDRPSSARSASPTLVIGRAVPKPTNEPQTSHHRRTSSAGNISPTTACFSFMTGSPGSLNLRPEHERLLGDMPTLDLGVTSGDYDDDGFHDHAQ